MNRTKVFIIIMFIMGLFGCKNHAPLSTVDQVDLQRYSGKWYEIAAYPQRFQKGCQCSTAEYSLTGKDYVKVTNRCKKEEGWDKAEGKAFVTKGSNNAKLKVQFFWPFKGKYWIIGLADDYSWAVVGHPNREYLWILCRQPHMSDATYQHIITLIEEKGFDQNKLKITNQDCHTD